MNTPTTRRTAKDHSPKVISFPTTLSGLSIAARQSVLWPCHAFNISIPQKKKRGLNVFEETVLKITGIESGDTEKIAQLTCLEKGLVAFIQHRLQQLGLLSSRYELSGDGRALLNEWQNSSDDNLEYTVAIVFVDLLSGKLLPYVSTEQCSYKKIERIGDRGIIEFLTNSTNEKSKVRAREIRPASDSFWKAVPDASDIIRAIRTFKRKYKRHALLNPGFDQHPPPVPMAEAISVNDNPELVYLHCDVVIQTGNSDILVTDGFGFGFSESFTSYLTSQDWRWLIDLKSKGVIDLLSSATSNEAGNEPPSGDGLKKYTHIARPLRRADNCLTKAESMNVNSSNEEQKFIGLTGSAVVALYEAIEWSLRLVVSDNPVTHWATMFSSQSYRDNNKALSLFATKIGFDVSDSVKSLLQVKPGKIRAVERGVAEMQPLLSLAIAGAINAPTHPFHNLAREDSGSLSFINILKKVRDPVSHGSSTDVEVSTETLGQYKDRTLRIIRALIPDISENTDSSNINQEQNIDQVRLKARIELDKSLGQGFLHMIDPSLREELMKVAALSQEQQLSDEQKKHYVFALASIMQLSLFGVARERTASEKSQINKRDAALNNIVQSGFYASSDSVPKQISTVNIERLDRAIQGASTTLGVQLLSVFILCSESELLHLRESYPSFIDLVAELIGLRGHNELLLHYSKNSVESLNSLKNNVFKAIKVIMEVF